MRGVLNGKKGGGKADRLGGCGGTMKKDNAMQAIEELPCGGLQRRESRHSVQGTLHILTHRILTTALHGSVSQHGVLL